MKKRILKLKFKIITGIIFDLLIVRFFLTPCSPPRFDDVDFDVLDFIVLDLVNLDEVEEDLTVDRVEA